MKHSQPNSAQPGCAPARRLTGGSRLSAAALPRALPLSLAAQWGRPVSASFFTRAPLLSLCLTGPVRQLPSRCPACPLFFLCTVGLPCQLRPPRPRRGPASAHSCTSPEFSTTTPAHAPSSLLRALPVPRARPSPHFAQLHPLSHSAHAPSSRRRPAPAFPTVQAIGDHARPPRAPPRGETPVPVPNFPYCALCSANFDLAGARPWRTAVLER
jgi:hypothetical protein